MRVLIVDQDRSELQLTARSLGGEFDVDAVATAGDCLDLLRQNAYHAIVVAEQSEDGPGLDLLAKVKQRFGEVLRIYAVRSERFAEEEARIGRLRVFQTVEYPFDFDQLRSALTFAAAAEAANVDTMTLEHIVLGEDGRPPPAVVAEMAAAEPTARRSRKPIPVPLTGDQKARLATLSALRTGHASARRGSAAVAVDDEQHTVTVPSMDGPAATQAFASSPRPRPRRAPVAPPNSPAARAAAAALLAREAAAARDATAATASTPALRDDSPFGTDRPAWIRPVALGSFVLVVVAAAGYGALQYFKNRPQTTENEAVVSVESNTDAVPAADPEPPSAEQLVQEIEAALSADDLPRARRAVRTLAVVDPNHSRLTVFRALLARREEVVRSASRRRPPSAAIVAPGSASNATTTDGEPVRSYGAPLAAPPPVPTLESLDAEATRAAPPPSTRAERNFEGRTVESGDPAMRASPRDASPVTSSATTPAADEAGASEPVVVDYRIVRKTPPVYPPVAERAGTEGSVTLAFAVGTDGRAKDVTVVTSRPEGVFDEAAVEAVRQWEFDPRTENGVPVVHRTTTRLQFKLDR